MPQDAQDGTRTLQMLAPAQPVCRAERQACTSGAAATPAHTRERSLLLRSTLNGSTKADRTFRRVSSSWRTTGKAKTRGRKQRGVLLASSRRADCCCWRKVRRQEQSRRWRSCSSCDARGRCENGAWRSTDTQHKPRRCERPSWAMDAQQEQRSHGGSGMMQCCMLTCGIASPTVVHVV